MKFSWKKISVKYRQRGRLDKKCGKLRYGYMKHYETDKEGFVMGMYQCK